MGVDPRHPSQGDDGPARLRVLQAIQDLNIHGYSPSVREVGMRTGLTSSATVQWHLERLQRDKFVTLVGDRPRTMQVTEAGKAALEPKG